MNGKITLHPEHGVNPSLEQKQCPIDGKIYETGGILMLGRNKGEEAPRHTVTGLQPCPDCQKLLDDGFIALVVVDSEKSGQKDINGNLDPSKAHRTGDIAWLKKHVANDLFEADCSKLEMIFVDQQIHERLQQMAKEAEDQTEKYISGEKCINCGKNQQECRCTDEELEAANKYD